MYEFEWDPAKAASNVRKHNVSFNDAAEVIATHSQSRFVTRSTASLRNAGLPWVARRTVDYWWYPTPTTRPKIQFGSSRLVPPLPKNSVNTSPMYEG